MTRHRGVLPWTVALLVLVRASEGRPSFLTRTANDNRRRHPLLPSSRLSTSLSTNAVDECSAQEYLYCIRVRGGASTEGSSESEPKKKKKKKKSSSTTKAKSTSGKPSKEKPRVKAPVAAVEAPPKKKTSKAAVASPKVAPKKSTPPKKKPPVVSAKARAHLDKPLKSNNPNYRIQRELKAFIQDPPENLTVKVGKNMRIWIVTMKGATNTVYEGETFHLRIAFPAAYPTVPPSVYFLPPNVPIHEHVYTNGDICLSLLGKDWRPTMTAVSIAVSILSILSSAQAKSLPMDNARHALNKPGEYQKDWVYHDDNC